MTSYWLETPLISGEPTPPNEGGIVVVGSGLSGVSTAYWLLEQGFEDITIVDDQPEKAASYRNCGHILNGTVESMQALVALHGEQDAREIWQFSVDICQEVANTINKLAIDAEYANNGYLVMAIDEAEVNEIHESIKLLNSFGFHSEFVSKEDLFKLGFRNVLGGRFEATSAQAHPVKFRNGLLQDCLRRGVKYHSQIEVKSVEDSNSKVEMRFNNNELRLFDAAVIATNAYSPLLSSFFKSRRLVEPFKGQIITSKPMIKPIKISYPHSFDHGYEYALRTADNRLMIGGWRNNTPSGEIGSFDSNVNEAVQEGLKEFVQNYYHLEEDIEWQYSWAGVMATSKTGLPFIGPTNSPLIFTTAGYTGHGFSWAHGSSKLLAQIIAGAPVPKVVRFFNPCH